MIKLNFNLRIIDKMSILHIHGKKRIQIIIIVLLLSLRYSEGYADSTTNAATASHPQLFLAPGIAYQPRALTPVTTAISPQSIKKVTDDLSQLKQIGFESIVTYSSEGVLGLIPEIARREGFKGAIIMGIWDIFSQQEWENAVSQSRFVNGYCLGNEGLGVRYQQDELLIKMQALRNLSKHPVTTSEPIDSYLSGPNQKWLLHHPDWLFPIAHPFWASKLNPQQSIEWILVRYDYLTTLSGKQVIIKEAGFPTHGTQGVNESLQLEFFRLLDTTDLAFYHFEAFDQPWKRYEMESQEVEAHWGLYEVNGNAKKIIPWLETRWKK